MNIQRLLIPVAALAFVCAAPPVKAQDDEVRSLDELLNLVETAGGRDAAAEAARIAEFEQNQTNQQQLLNDANARRAADHHAVFDFPQERISLPAVEILAIEQRFKAGLGGIGGRKRHAGRDRSQESPAI